MTTKSKLWKAEKQEHLAFHGESERIKFLLRNTTQKISAILCIINCTDTELLSLSLEQNEKDLIIILKNNHKLANETLHLLNNESLDLIIKTLLNKSAVASFLIDTLQGLVKSFDIRFGMNASAAKLHTKQMRRAWFEQKKNRLETRGLRNELYGLTMAMKARVAAKRRLIREQQNTIIELQQNCRDEISKLCEKTEVTMDEACAISQEHQEDLERELICAENTLSELQIEHQQQEKNLRKQKRETEKTLEEIIHNYDEEMFKLHDEMIGTEQAYLEECEQFRSLQIKFNAQEILYKRAMEEKAREEQEEFDRKIKLFRQRVAAGKIQQCWRGYLRRKHERSKGKKGKKGRKKANK